MNFILSNINFFVATFLKYKINTQLRIAHFLAQLSYETLGFTALVENINYSSTRLREVFPNYFTIAQASAYANKPISIANRVYANRLGNGNEASGDGYKYRGRGLIHLTGKSNYQAYTNYSGTNIVDNPDLAARIDIALDIAGWFWNARNINQYADNDDIVGVTKKVNGGSNGLEGRNAKLNAYKKEDLVYLLKKKAKKPSRSA